MGEGEVSERGHVPEDHAKKVEKPPPVLSGDSIPPVAEKVKTVGEGKVLALSDFAYSTDIAEDASRSSDRSSPESDVAGRAYASVSPFDARRVPIGLTPLQTVGFEEVAIRLHKDDYLKSLDETKRREFEELEVDDQLLAIHDWLTDPKRAENNEKPRLELRQCIRRPGLLANVALACTDGPTRDRLFAEFQKSGVADGLMLVKAGSTTIEISSADVDKSTPIRFLQHGDNFQKALTSVGYTAGPSIDARKTQTVIISDADGTLWDSPVSGQHPESTNLLNSAARGPVLSYLAQGGVLVVNTGNDPARTVRRFLPAFAGIPDRLRHEMLSRVIFASGGGGSLAGFVGGCLTELEGYHDFDPKTPTDPAKLDMLYLGDDPKAAGNDMPAFLASEGSFICVAPEKYSAHVEESGIEKRVQYGKVKSSHSIFSAVVMQAMTNRAALAEGRPLFSDMDGLMANTGHVGDARELTKSTIERMGGRKGVDRVISEEIDAENPPLRVTAKATTLAAKGLPPPEEGIDPTYASALARVSKMPQVEGRVSTPVDTRGVKSPEALVDAFLDGSDMVDKSKAGPVTLRILEPGNNDQSTPMHIAYQIRYLREELQKRGGKLENLHVQVLVLGKGGHATTALYPQIGQIVSTKEGKLFSGTEEALSLGGTLQNALIQAKVPCTIVSTLDGSEDVPGGVSIRLEKESTDTGANVRNSIHSWHEKVPDFQWVVAATPSSKRQLLTFAHQYKTPESKCFDELWGMPLQRSETFVRDSLSDYQAVTEFYAGMAEKARLLNYAVQKGPYIPVFTTDGSEFQKTLDSLYTTYAKLEGKDVEEVKRTVTIKQMQNYFQGKFTTLEQSIPWSKAIESQSEFTAAAMRKMTGKAKSAEIRQALALLGEYEEVGIDDASLAKALTELKSYLSGARGGGHNLYTLAKRVNACARYGALTA